MRRGLEISGLIAPYYRWRERRAALAPLPPFDDGHPMPPRELIMRVSGAGDARWFGECGRKDADRFTALAEANGLSLNAGIAALDLGCGAGRIARWLAPRILAGGGRFEGRDIDRLLVRWCQDNLVGSYACNRILPPLDLNAGLLDLVYAHSVLTHLREPTALAWLAETRRVLRPGGIAIMTFHDETYAAHWAPPELQRTLGDNDYVVWNNALEGTNYMSAWTTRDYFRRLAEEHFEICVLLPGGTDAPDQAVAVLRARG